MQQQEDLCQGHLYFVTGDLSSFTKCIATAYTPTLVAQNNYHHMISLCIWYREGTGFFMIETIPQDRCMHHLHGILSISLPNSDFKEPLHLSSSSSSVNPQENYCSVHDWKHHEWLSTLYSLTTCDYGERCVVLPSAGHGQSKWDLSERNPCARVTSKLSSKVCTQVPSQKNTYSNPRPTLLPDSNIWETS